jgi:drug/metabolite transporter (DMT)-like permease
MKTSLLIPLGFIIVGLVIIIFTGLWGKRKSLIYGVVATIALIATWGMVIFYSNALSIHSAAICALVTSFFYVMSFIFFLNNKRDRRPLEILAVTSALIIVIIIIHMMITLW